MEEKRSKEGQRLARCSFFFFDLPLAPQKKLLSLLPPPQRTRNEPSARPGRSHSRWLSPRRSPEGSGPQWPARTSFCPWRRGGARYGMFFFAFAFFFSSTKARQVAAPHFYFDSNYSDARVPARRCATVRVGDRPLETMFLFSFFGHFVRKKQTV